MELHPDAPAERNKNFMMGMVRLVMHTRGKMSVPAMKMELNLLSMMFSDREITVEEAYEGFKSAYSDQYLPSSGVSWRHIYKHVEEMRKGSDRKLYSYREMLSIVDKEQITTDHFEIIKEIREKAIEQNKDVNKEAIKCWKRKWGHYTTHPNTHKRTPTYRKHATTPLGTYLHHYGKDRLLKRKYENVGTWIFLLLD